MNIPSQSALLDRTRMIRTIQELCEELDSVEAGSSKVIEDVAQLKADYLKLKDIVGELGGNVEYLVPSDGKLTSLLSKGGIVKLSENVESQTYTGGITAKNTVNLKLNGKTLTFSGGNSNPGIMTRGKQQLTIDGSGTINAGGKIAVECNGAESVITLGGTMFGRPSYINNRAGGELIYCYSGTIYIKEGIFRNNSTNSTFMLNCYDANYRAGTAKIIVSGGKFYDFDPGNCTTEGAGTSYLAEGYKSVPSTVIEEGVEHTVYTVSKI